MVHVLGDTFVEMERRFLGEVFVKIRAQNAAAEAAKPTHNKMLLVLRKTQKFADRFSQAVPLGFFFPQTFLPSSREAIDPRPPIVLGDPPFGGDPARLLHTMKRRIQRSLLYAQRIVRDLLNARGDTVSMLWLATQRFQNKKIERPLECIGFFHVPLYIERYGKPLWTRCQEGEPEKEHGLADRPGQRVKERNAIVTDSATDTRDRAECGFASVSMCERGGRAYEFQDLSAVIRGCVHSRIYQWISD
jgi:hypothetical protein